MISITVKTLDSQNHEFSVDDDMTVRQFKECVAERTTITVDNQRLIYCGRVLMDEKLLREYDVNGKVVHLVQRPPPSMRSNNTNRSGNSENNTGGTNVRGAPIFRAIDGMVLGAMSIPMNANNGTPQAAAPSLNPSSTLCMNRITVARYMLECANNIAAYLEDPSRGLNNTAMDILAQQTMESTVLEVGISAVSDVEIPQLHMQNLVQAFQGAVSAAFRQNGIQNIRVMQQGSDQNGVQAVQIISGEDGTPISTGAEATPTPAGTSNTTANNSGSNTSEPAASPTGTAQTSPRQQTTSTQTLAEVVQQMRNVQTRMEPFIQQYYDILSLDPTFNPAQLENSQRVFDRVSEALHYLSHAQHAISDLMLDLSTTVPRHLCCRPILVEQSAFVSSGITLPGPVIPLAQVIRPNGNNNETNGNNNGGIPTQTPTIRFQHPAAAQPQQQPPPPPAPPTATAPVTESPTQGGEQHQPHPMLLPPSREHLTALQNINNTISQQGQSRSHQIPISISRVNSSRRVPSLLIPMRPVAIVERDGPNEIILNYGNLPQFQVARLIQAVMNSAQLHADVHLEINGPNMTSGPQTTTTTTNNTTDSANNELTINIHVGDVTQPRVTTATHPTTSTQTRSTARPHVHLTNLPGAQVRNIRSVPANMLSAFDRFLPCNSHHIRDNQQADNQNLPNVLLRNRQTQRPADRQNLQRPQRAQSDSRLESQRIVIQNNNANSSSLISQPHEFANLGGTILNTPISILGGELSIQDLLSVPLSMLNRIREGFLTHLQTSFFNGLPITDENMTSGVNNGIELLEVYMQPLSQLDLPDYDARRSVENLIKDFLPTIFRLIRDDISPEFGTRLIRTTNTFVKRLFTILVTCIGRNNTKTYFNQISQMAISSNILNSIPQSHLQILINRQVDEIETDLSDVREFLVIRRPAPGENMEQLTNQMQPMEIDEMDETSSPSMNVDQEEVVISVVNREQLIQPPAVEDDENLPAVVIGSEPWHINFPTSSWIPVITRDIARQRRQNQQPPFSDAYLSGMSSKRRKIISDTKPPVDVQNMLSEGIRRAITTTGLAPSNMQTSIDDISSAISSDPAVQLSYKEALKTNVQERLQKEPDYNPDRFPSSSKYFNNNK